MEPGGDIDEYHHLIPVCLLEPTVFEKMQGQNNTDNKNMMKERNKRLPPSVITLPQHRKNKNFTGGWGAKKMCVLCAQIKLFPPPPSCKNL